MNKKLEGKYLLKREGRTCCYQKIEKITPKFIYCWEFVVSPSQTSFWTKNKIKIYDGIWEIFGKEISEKKFYEVFNKQLGFILTKF